ncbi:MAG: zf-HC2 domain-containing protein [Anaerolineae bacterium]|nr:zf-HC2 domain-containing protein [Anaerolineae bacterium]
MKHLNFRYLVRYIEGDLAEAQREKADAHLADCADCRRELERVRRLRGEIGEFVSPPAELVGRVLAAVRRRKTRRAERPRYQPALRFDSWTQWAALGARGAPQERQLLFSEGAFDLDVQITRDQVPGAYILRGQVLNNTPQPAGLEGIELRIVDGNGVPRRGLTDKLGRFKFTQLEEGVYSLQVIFDDHEIVLDSLPVSDRWSGPVETNS